MPKAQNAMWSLNHWKYKILTYTTCAIQDWRWQGFAPVGVPVWHLSLSREICAGLSAMNYYELLIPFARACDLYSKFPSNVISGLLCQNSRHFGGQTDLIIGNYTDGNLVASSCLTNYVSLRWNRLSNGCTTVVIPLGPTLPWFGMTWKMHDLDDREQLHTLWRRQSTRIQMLSGERWTRSTISLANLPPIWFPWTPATSSSLALTKKLLGGR